jgi:hypothetical protein
MHARIHTCRHTQMQEAHLQILSCRAMAGGLADTIARACVHECPCDGVRTVDIRGSVLHHLSVRTNSFSIKSQTLRNDLVSRPLGSLSEPHRFTARAAGCVGRLSCLQRVPLTSSRSSRSPGPSMPPWTVRAGRTPLLENVRDSRPQPARSARWQRAANCK